MIDLFKGICNKICPPFNHVVVGFYKTLHRHYFFLILVLKTTLLDTVTERNKSAKDLSDLLKILSLVSDRAETGENIF